MTSSGQSKTARQLLERELAQQDAKLYGVGYLFDGIRVDPTKISVVRREQDGEIAVVGTGNARAIRRLSAERDAIMPWEPSAVERRMMLMEVIKILRGDT